MKEGEGTLSSAVAKVWQLLPHDPAAVERLARGLRVPPVIGQLLLNRGLDQPEVAQRFLTAPLTGLHPPGLLPGVDEAAGRLFEAIRQGRKVCVYGDYDADGVTGTAILKLALELAGGKVDVHVPHRLEEGYGLNTEALEKIAGEGTSVVITVDCGIASIHEAEVARKLGLELIITDHHEFKPELPAAPVLVHPRLPGTSYPFGGLSGAAVAFKVAWALAQRTCGGEKVTPRFREFLLDAVALASLGIVADVVPLHEENRILVRHGLNRLRQQPPLGLKVLLETAGLPAGSKVRASDIGFRLAPRINAAGRLGCARLVVDLLTTTDEHRAQDLARYLDEQNAQRKTLEREMVRSARQMVEAGPLHDDPALVLANLASPHWHAGVIGIVASRLVDLYARPVLIIALRPDGESPEAGLLGQGSGRSIPGFALHEALSACDEYLLAHGGHKAAAGFRIRGDRVDDFRRSFCDYTARCFPSGPPAPTLVLDAEIPLSALTLGLVRDLDRLEPYGADNREPIFLTGDLRVEGEPRRVGQGERHLSFRVRQGQTALKAIAFDMADRLDQLMSAGGACCLAFTPKLNEWQGRVSVDLVVVDLQPGAQAQLGTPARQAG
jgi:single-stranded-DNA-specific exonuclease